MLSEMTRAWISNTTTLVALFDAAQGHPAAERSTVDRGTGSFRQGWSDILLSLSPREAAMLQDLTWWGPQMKQRLVQLANVHTAT
jgi:hypothetical protein